MARRLAGEQTNQMPDASGVDQERKEKQPAPPRKRAVGPLAENLMQPSAVRDPKPDKVAAEPDEEEQPAAFQEPQGDEREPEQGELVFVAQGALLPATRDFRIFTSRPASESGLVSWQIPVNRVSPEPVL